MSGLVGILLVAGLEMCFRQRSVDESVLGIHDSRLGVAVGFFKDTGSSLVALDEDGLAALSGLLAHETLDICVVLQQLQGYVTRRIAGIDAAIGLQVGLDVTDAVLYLMSVVDVDVSGRMADTLIDLDNGAEQRFNPHTTLERGWNQWRT